MSLTALFAWLVTVTGGLYLLTIWVIEYDREFQSAAQTRLPVPVISAHALLAVTGLAIWGAYLLTDTAPLAWTAAAILAVVATLGLTMGARWIKVYRTYAGSAVRARSATSTSVVTVPPERHFPLPVVIGHGLFATATIALVVLTALGVGAS